MDETAFNKGCRCGQGNKSKDDDLMQESCRDGSRNRDVRVLQEVLDVQIFVGV